MRPVVNGFTKIYMEQIDFRILNIESAAGQAWADRYGLFGHPVILLLDAEGIESWRYIGVVTAEEIDLEIQKVLEK